MRATEIRAHRCCTRMRFLLYNSRPCSRTSVAGNRDKGVRTRRDKGVKTRRDKGVRTKGSVRNKGVRVGQEQRGQEPIPVLGFRPPTARLTSRPGACRSRAG